VFETIKPSTAAYHLELIN